MSSVRCATTFTLPETFCPAEGAVICTVGSSTSTRAAGAAWFVTLAACTGLIFYGGVEIFFVSLPGWFIAAVLYIAGSMLIQRKNRLEAVL